jgi:hypothetical protein
MMLLNYETFLKKIKTAFNKNFPLQKKKNKKIDYFKSPWMTRGIICN